MSCEHDSLPSFRFAPKDSPFLTEEMANIVILSIEILQNSLREVVEVELATGSRVGYLDELSRLSPTELQEVFPAGDGVCVVICRVKGLEIQMDWVFDESVEIRRFGLSVIHDSSEIFWIYAADLFVKYCEFLMPEWASCSSWSLDQQIYAKYVLALKCLPSTCENIEWAMDLQGTAEALLSGLEMENGKMLGWMGVLPNSTAVENGEFSSFSFSRKIYGILYMARSSLLGKVCRDVVDELETLHQITVDRR